VSVVYTVFVCSVPRGA